MVQFLRLPGKEGKPRKKVGNVSSSTPPGGITIPCEEPIVIVLPDGSRTSWVKPLIDPSFDLRRFRRALHHIGLNAFAWSQGVEKALEPRFDAVRKYVRAPHKAASLPFAQHLDPLKGFRGDAVILLDRDDKGEYVAIALSPGVVFAVDLTGAGGLEVWADKQFPMKFELLDASFRVPRAAKQKGKRRFRVTILPDS